MTIPEINAHLKSYHEAGKKIFVTSSFQTHSIPLLHILKQHMFRLMFFFQYTGFHFPETLLFRDEVTKLLDLSLIDVHPQVSKINQKNADGQFYFVSDPDYSPVT